MIKFPPLIEATFVKRPNRFSVEAGINGKPVIAHLHDPGRLQELLVSGARLFLAEAISASRKTSYDIILVRKGRQLVVVYSTLANRLVGRLLSDGEFSGLKSWELIKKEPAFGNHRFDFELGKGDKKMFIEVKSVSLVEKGVALFPDAPTQRGNRHLLALAKAVRQGYRAMVIFIVTRHDALSFRANEERDPAFSRTLQYVVSQKVEMLAFKCKIKRESMSLDSRMPVLID
jgi:sugar fermentation stimulation protein A